MIVCTHCESPQFLQITESDMQFRNGRVRRIVERYHCTMCHSNGTYRYDGDGEDVSGSVEILDDRPRMKGV